MFQLRGAVSDERKDQLVATTIQEFMSEYEIPNSGVVTMRFQ